MIKHQSPTIANHQNTNKQIGYWILIIEFLRYSE